MFFFLNRLKIASLRIGKLRIVKNIASWKTSHREKHRIVKKSEHRPPLLPRLLCCRPLLLAHAGVVVEGLKVVEDARVVVEEVPKEGGTTAPACGHQNLPWQLDWDPFPDLQPCHLHHALLFWWKGLHRSFILRELVVQLWEGIRYSQSHVSSVLSPNLKFVIILCSRTFTPKTKQFE